MTDYQRTASKPVAQSKGFIPGYHDRKWEEGPPEWWMQEHQDFQEMTIFRTRGPLSGARHE